MIDKHKFNELIGKHPNKNFLFDLYARIGICQEYGLLTEIIPSLAYPVIWINDNTAVKIHPHNQKTLSNNLKAYLDSNGIHSELFSGLGLYRSARLYTNSHYYQISL